MNRQSCPLTKKEILDIYFMENRARLLEIAAFLDRLDRAADGAGQGEEDFRLAAFLDGLRLLLETPDERARTIQLTFSDPTSEPVASSAGLRAQGAWQGEEP